MWDMFEAATEYFKLDQVEMLSVAEKFSFPVAWGLGIAVSFVIATLYLSARYTHQIYGPMVSIRRFLDDLIGGRRPPRIQLRSTDQLQDLVERLNRLSEALSVATTPQSLDSINRFLDELLLGRSPADLEFADGPLKELGGKLNQLARRNQVNPKR